MSGGSTTLDRIAGRMLPVRGDDIDTDRIMPARFLKAITFEGIDRHLFEDERSAEAARGRIHPVGDPRFAGAAVLVVNRNFGCGSSREHAPQAIWRRGVRALVGESFAEIFFGNAVAIGLPCVTLPGADVVWLQDLAEREPASEVGIDLVAGEVTATGRRMAFDMPRAAREALVTGAWDATGLLLDSFETVEAVAGRLPYVSGFA